MLGTGGRYKNPHNRPLQLKLSVRIHCYKDRSTYKTGWKV